MNLLQKLNRKRLTDFSEEFIEWIRHEQQSRTVARKKAQQMKAIKKGKKC